MSIEDKLIACDTSLFELSSQTSEGDRRSLLLIQALVRQVLGNYVYLEVGSHLGGTLLPHLRDSACRHIYSIDKRPAAQPDERGMMYSYDDNSTERMLRNLASATRLGEMLKIQAFDLDCAELATENITVNPDLFFIDGEHTNTAVFSDFMNLLRFSKQDAVFSFHDANLVTDGLQNIESVLTYLGRPFRSLVLSDLIFVIFIGSWCERIPTVLEGLAVNKAEFFAQSKLQVQQILRSHPVTE